MAVCCYFPSWMLQLPEFNSFLQHFFDGNKKNAFPAFDCLIYVSHFPAIHLFCHMVEHPTACKEVNTMDFKIVTM